MFKDSSPELVDVMSQMLELNPYFRPTAKQLLRNPIFDPVRVSENELIAQYKIRIKIDIDDKEEPEDPELLKTQVDKILTQIV